MNPMLAVDPARAIFGGLLIGSAAGLYWIGAGRVAGISGIAASAVGLAPGTDRRLSIAFVVGLLLTSLLIFSVDPADVIAITHPVLLLIAAGVLVGFGTRLGSGCTSGHGVCGLARGSRRSLVATIVFMSTAMVTVYVVRHLMPGAP